MDDHQRPEAGADDQAEKRAYEAPQVEDLDSTYGPSVTAAGKTVFDAPRGL